MRRVISVVAVLFLAAGTIVSGSLIRDAFAQQDSEDPPAHPMVGAWREAAYEEGFPPFELLVVFVSDGTISSGGVPLFPAAPGVMTYVGPGVGVWEPTGDNSVAYTVDHMIANADGTPAGRQTIYGTREVSEDGMTFSGEYTFTIVDPAGNIVFSSTGTDEGTRMVVESAPLSSPVATPEG